MRQFYIYLLASESRRLYTGVTNDLHARVYQHKHPIGETFGSRHHIHKLVYFEVTRNPRTAITREKQLKAGSRSKKIALINTMNPEWRDLSEDFVATK